MKMICMVLLTLVSTRAVYAQHGFPYVKDGSRENAAQLDTARGASYLTTREKDMVWELNQVRANPQSYIPYLQEHLNNQREIQKHATGTSTLVSIKNGKKTVTTINAADTFKEAIHATEGLIAELKAAKPIAILTPMECIYQAASKHGSEAKKRGFLDHIGVNGSTPMSRISGSCGGRIEGNENLAGGSTSVRQIVIDLLVDAGIPGYGHRRNMLDPGWRYVATYEVGPIGPYETNWVQNFGK